MQNKSSIENKIEATLNSLDGLQRATPNPFFYTRLIGRLQNLKQNKWENFSAFIARPAVAFAGICFILIMNAIIIFTNVNGTSKDQTELATVDEYSQVATAPLYDVENIKP